jgi:hypothetical protein
MMGRCSGGDMERRDRLEKWLLAVETNCADPSRETEYNQWYDSIQVSDILETPGILRATRYENGNPREGQGKFLVLYEIETEDIGQTLALEWDIALKKAGQGRSSDLKVMVSASVYRQIGAPVESK